MAKLLHGDKVTQQFTVKRPQELLDFLVDSQIRKSKNAIQSVLRRKLITVNGKLVTQYNHELKSGDKVAVMKFDQSKKVKKLKGMTIVYEDDYLVVIDKDYGLLSVSTDKEKLTTAYAILSNYVKKRRKPEDLLVVQRLEREISGLMVFVKSLDIQGKFKRNWNYLVPKQVYSGIIQGEMPEEKGEIQSWLTEDKNYKVYSNAFNNGGVEAITKYAVQKTNGRYSLVKFEQETRHRNQVRAQQEQLQRPIVGDRKYGATVNPMKRVLLHISEMEIRHPLTAKKMTFTSPLSKNFVKLLSSKEEL